MKEFLEGERFGYGKVNILKGKGLTLERIKGGWQWQTEVYSRPDLDYVVKVPRLYWYGLPLFWRLIPSIRERIFSSYEMTKEILGNTACDYWIEKNFNIRVWQGKGVKTMVAPKVIIQRKVTSLSSYLKKLIEEERQDEAKLWLVGFVDSVSLIEGEELMARDRWLIENWGIDKVARIVWLDPGLLLKKRTTLGGLLQGLEDRFCIWLNKRILKQIDPELAGYYMQILSESRNNHKIAVKRLAQMELCR